MNMQVLVIGDNVEDQLADYDGKADTVSFFESGKLVRQESDLDGDDLYETVTLYEEGVRARV